MSDLVSSTRSTTREFNRYLVSRYATCRYYDMFYSPEIPVPGTGTWTIRHPGPSWYLTRSRTVVFVELHQGVQKVLCSYCSHRVLSILLGSDI